MEFFDGGDGLPRAKPSGVTVSCNACPQPVQYDPANTESLCPSCEAKLTRSYATPVLGNQTFTRLGPGGSLHFALMPRLQQTVSDAQAYKFAHAYHTQQPSTKASAISTSPLIRRSVMGPTAQLQPNRDMTPDENEDNFVDAQEEMHSGLSKSAAAEGAENNDDENGSQPDDDLDESDTELAEANMRAAKELEAIAAEEESDSDESSSGPKEVLDEVNEDGDGAMEIDDGCTKTKHTPPHHRQDSDDLYLLSEHTKGCKRSRRVSTPPDEGPVAHPHKTLVPAPPKAPDPLLDASPNLKYLRTFHPRAVQFIPRLPLAAHRYWIGVLNVNIKSFSQEKHFVWMKGNRLTTVETVWHMYQQTTADDEFVLLVGLEKVGFKTRMEELDYFNDKKIMMRAIPKDRPEAKGRLVSEGVIPKVQVGEKKKKTVVKEVIEIEDD